MRLPLGTGIAGHVATTGVFSYLVKMIIMMIIVRILFDKLEGHVITSPAITDKSLIIFLKTENTAHMVL